MTNFRYQDFVNEQRAGKVHGVFIDDTGSPGLLSTPSHLHSERKTYAAVIVPKYVLPEIWQQFPGAAQELRSLTGAAEFHFADIWAGRKQFKNVGLDVRLQVFRFMAYIFGRYRFPVLIQTLDPDALNHAREVAQFPDKLGPFDFNRHQHLALFLLLLHVKGYLVSTFRDDPLARVFVDEGEGFQKNGNAVPIPSFESVFADGLICFAKSDTVLPIQLADFAAFCSNRTQLLLGKESPSGLDRAFLDLCQVVARNIKNLPLIKANDWFNPETVN